MVQRFFILTCISLWVHMMAYGQQPDGMPTFSLKGKIVEKETQKPVPFATVYLKHLKDSTYFTGGLANDSGNFIIEQMRPGMYELRVTFMGFATYSDTLNFQPPDFVKNIGVINLVQDAKNIKEFTLEDEKADFQLGIDRKIFNVEKNAIVSGGSALDALRQVPTVTVDVDGKISLRGSESLVVFINGKPSGLTVDNRSQILQQIPASNIERIELITNPSAKYDAEGMNGIINIITKKQLSDGINGTLQVGIGTNNKYNISGSLNVRIKNFTMSHTLGFRYNEYWNEGYSLRTTTPVGFPGSSINQYSYGNRISASPTISGNFDWALKKDASFSINYLFSYNNESNPDSIRYNYLDNASWLLRETYRTTVEKENNFNVDGGLNYTKKFKKGNDIFASTNLSYNNSSDNSNFRQQEYTLYHEPDTSVNAYLQNTYRKYISLVSVTQVDYTHPIKDKFKIEAGAKVTIRNITNDLKADSFDYAQGRLITDSTISNVFHYLDDVNAVYGTFSGSFKKWGFQAGLRIEQTNVWGQQEVGNTSFTKNYINFFPSVFFQYKISDVHQLQLAYARRINRPGLGQLNPFAEYDDPLNLRIGNPDLNPENIDAVELTYSMNLKAHNLIATGYFRHVDGTIQRYRSLNGDIVTMTFLNLDRSINFGLELVLRNKWTKWWSMSTNFNLFRNQIIGTSPLGNLDATNLSYNIRSQQSFKMAKIAELQLSFFFMGPMTMPQGRMAEMWSLDAALKFDLFKNRAILTFNIQDIFKTRRFSIFSSDTDFYADVYRRRESRIFTVQFTWKFGKVTGSETPKKRKPTDGGGGGSDTDMGY